MLKLGSKQHGDTIIEVLICMAIVSFSLSSSFAISRQSIRKVRDSEERSISTQLAQQQIERMKALLKIHPDMATTNNGNKWLYNTNGISPSIDYKEQFDWLPAGQAPMRDTDAALYPGMCIFKNLGIYYTSGLVLPGDPDYDATLQKVDPRCATNQSGAFYCEDHPAECTRSLSISTVTQAGYTYAAFIGNLDKNAVSLPVCTSDPIIHYYCKAEDQFSAIAGTYQVGGDGANNYRFSLVAIPYRIHQ